MGIGTIKIENTGKGVFEGTCNCDCTGGGGGGECPHPSYPFTGKAMADFGKTERCVAISKGGGSGAGGTEWTDAVKQPDLAESPGTGPWDPQISPDGQWLFRGTSSAPYLVIYKLVNNGWVKQTYEGAMPGVTGQVRFLPDSKSCVVANLGETGKPIYVYKLVDNQWRQQSVLWNMPRSGSIAVSADGSRLVVGSSACYVYKFVGDTFVSEDLPGGINMQSYSFAFSPDGKFLAFTRRYAPGITMYKFEAGAWVQIEMPIISIDSKYTGKRVVFSPDGKTLAEAHTGLADANYRAVTLYALEGESWVVKNNMDVLPDLCEDIAFSPDGQWLMGVNYYAKNLLMYKLENGIYKRKIGLEIPINSQYITMNNEWIVITTTNKTELTLFKRDAALPNELHPFTKLIDAVSMEGFTGVGFTQTALAEGETGTADIMFE